MLKTRRFLYILIILASVSAALAGCSPYSQETAIVADEVMVFYGVSSYAMVETDEKIVEELVNAFNGLKFAVTDEELDISTTLTVHFYKDKETVAIFNVDNKNVFWLNGDAKCLKISSGLFDYDTVYEIYENSKNSE